MVLSNVAILQALREGRLIIDPKPAPTAPSVEQKCPYDTTAIDLRLGSEIVEVHPQDPHCVIDLRNGGFVNIANIQSTRKDITDTSPYHLLPNRFVLAKTFEKVELPIRRKGKKRQLAARIEGKSSFARCGLLVHFTAPTIHSGFAGTITLEMANLGPFEIVLYPKMYICQLIIEEVDGIPFRNDSSFQNQSRPGGQRA